MNLTPHSPGSFAPTRKATQQDIQTAMAALSCLPARVAGQVDKPAFFTALEGVTAADLAGAVRAILRNSLGHSFFPAPPEVRAECDRLHQERASAAMKAQRARELAEERSRYAKPIDHSPAAKARVAASYAAFCQSYAEAKAKEGGAMQKDWRPVGTPGQFQAKYGLDEEAFANLPDAKTDWRNA